MHFFFSLFLKPIRSTFFCSIFVAKVGVKIRYFILGVGYSVSSLPGVCRPTKKRKERSFSNNFVFILFFWQKENVNYCYCCPNIFKPYVFGWMQSFYAYTLHRIQCRKLLIHFNAFDWKWCNMAEWGNCVKSSRNVINWLSTCLMLR